MYLKDIEKSVKEVITASLASSDGAALDTLNLDASFLELGLNSVLAVEVVEAINQKLGIELGVEVMFDYRDIKELTHFIFQHYGKEDLSKELPALADHVRLPGLPRDSKKTQVSAIEAESEESQEALGERQRRDVAIIGISGRFAGSANLEAFWQHLQAGESCIEEIKRKGWETKAYYDPDPERMNTSISKWGGMLQNVDKFDPLFFNLSPLEATRMDPQQRLFLEEAYRAFEDAGYSAEQLSDKKVGVFVGARSGDYKEQALCKDSAMCRSVQPGEIDAPLFLGNDMAILAARIPYFLNFKGPSLTIDTACSSSLVAIHLACESIRTGEAEMALAGGVFVLSSPEFYVMTSKTQMLSPDGKCKTFDNTANGIVIGEGVGAVILKPLEAALKDGDHIYGVILGSGMNQDGRTKGITAPSMLSQKALLSDVYRKASIHPETVSYIETHGTGTKLGDPIEIKALTEAFREFTDKTQFCAIGSHKPNFGHTIMSAGIAGVFKILLAMKYKQIPPTINIEEVNQHIDFEESPFFINTELREWTSPDSSPRRAGVSSFGFSGTNCHLILEEPPQNKETAPKPIRPAYFFPLSAKTKEALSQKVADLVKWLEKEGETYALADISYTLVQGRSHFAARAAVVASDTNDLLHTLKAIQSRGSQEYEGINAKGRRSEQMEPLFQTFGNGLLNELSEDTIFEHEEYKEKLAALADLYVKGYDLDWGKIFQKGRYHRVPLPTYPFIGESYWIAEANKQKRVALRSLADPPVPSRRDGQGDLRDTPKGAVGTAASKSPSLQPLSVPESLPARADQPQPSIPLSSGLSFSQSRSNNGAEAVDRALARTSQSGPKGDDRPILVETKALPTASTLSGTGRREALDRGQPYPPLQEELARSLATALYMEEGAIDLEKPFGEMGLDSVLGVEWIRSLNKQYASSLKATCIYDYPTIRQLAAFLQKEVLKHGGAIQPTPVQSMSTDVPQHGTCKIEEAEHLFHQPEEREGRALGTEPGPCPPINPTYQRVIVEGPGGIDDLLINEGDLPELKDDEVRIAVRAFSLNFGDLLCVKGLYHTMPPYPFTPGFEASGVVLNVGRAVTAFQIGDPVMAIAGATLGAHASVMTCPEESVFHKPSSLSFEEACTLPVVGITMIAAFERACLKQGEKILIHTATGGTGLIATQLANHYGAQIYATAGSQAKLDYLAQLGVPYRINYRETDFEQEIKHLTEGQGIDVVINTLSGDAIQKGMNCLSPGGRYIEIAITALKSAAGAIDLSVLSHNQTFHSINLRKLVQTDSTSLKRYWHEMLQLVHKGIIAPTICQVFPWERLKDAYRYMEKRQNIGKIVVRMPEANGASLRADLQQKGLSTSTIFDKAEPAPATRRKEAIAIIGMSGKYPDAKNLSAYWDNLVQGKNAIREVPLSRWDPADYYDPSSTASGKISCKWLGVLDDIECFDPLFFHLSPAEAERMDPQQRLFLEEGYKAFEDAGYSPGLLSNRKCGVYLGIIKHEYSLLLSERSATEKDLLGTSPAIAAARLAYHLNLKGPALAIDTACSSSLVAMHVACQALKHQEIDMALVGGANLCLTSDFYVSMCHAGMLSPSGQCNTFDASANGYVPGEGVGAVVLKRLADAEADHDQIYGVIIGSGMNQDGATNGITAPSVNSQIELEREIYEKYAIDPTSISYVEMHGTGTKLGDPIELQALATVFQERNQRKQYCAIGSVKTNIGHILAAAGVASLQKVLLQMQHKQLVPSLHFEQPNPHFDFAASPFYVNTSVQDWQAEEDIPRRAAVSSFGFSGTNAHVVIEEYIPSRDRALCRSKDRADLWREAHRLQLRSGVSPLPKSVETPTLFVLSAKSEQQLKTYAQDMKHWIQAHEELALADIAFTLQLGREAMDYRLAILADSREVLLQRLAGFVENQTSTGVYTAQVKKRSLGMQPLDSDVALLEEDSDGQSLLHLWFQKKKLEKIAQVWVKGVNVDWMLLYTVGAESAQDTPIGANPTIGASPMARVAPALPHRISLPTYPFARERYWIPIGASPMAATIGTVPCACPSGDRRTTDPDQCALCHRPQWSPTGCTSHELANIAGQGHIPFLHPLVQCNISDFFEQRFSSTFHGQEFFLADHVINGQRMMPGVAYLEMARAAIAQAIRKTKQEEGHMLPVEQVHRLRHIAWVRPLVVSSQPVTAYITLTPQENGTISFVVSGDATVAYVQGSAGVRGSSAQEEKNTELVYCQGTAELHVENTVRSTSQNLDLTAVLARCQPQWGEPTAYAAECYRQYRSLGFNYGPSFKGIEQLSRGEDEVLARFRLPEVVAQTWTEGGKPLPYVLHPSVLDAALHAGIGLQTEQELLVPFALDEIEILGEVPTQGWTWIRRSPGSATGKVQVVDVDVCDDAGHIALRLRGLSRRMLPEDPVQTTMQDAGASTSSLALGTEAQSISMMNTLGEGRRDGACPHPPLYIPLWDRVSLPQPAQAPVRLSEEPRTPVAQGTQATISGDTTKQVVIVGGTPDEQGTITQVYPSARILKIPAGASIERLAQHLQELGAIGTRTGTVGTRLAPIPTIPHVFWLAPSNPELEHSQESILAAKTQGVLACFRLIQALLQLGYANQPLQWTMITHGTRVLHATETGDPTHASLLGLFGSLAKEYAHWSIQLVDLPADAPLPLSEMHRLPADPHGHGWLYRNGHWYRQILVPLDIPSLQTPEAYRRGGVYVIIGGAGGIGEVWSEYLIRRYQAQIIWIGRRKIDAGILLKQERLAALGPRPHYITADATDRFALQEAYEEIKRNFGQIHGVVHSAMVLLDQSLAKMDEERFQAALAAKVDVSVRLAQVFEHESLDFVLFFSSLNAFISNAGQSNYAAGCTFEDAFAAQLGRDWHCRVKVMNWGYWGSVGVVASPAYRKYMTQAGLGSIEPAEAMEALEFLLASPVDQMMLLKTVTAPVPTQTPGKPHLSTVAPWEEMIQTEETMTVYPEILPSYIHSLHNYRPPRLKPPTASITASSPVALEADISRLEDTILPKEGKK